MSVELIGIVASLMTTTSSVPQMLKIIRTRSVGDISLATVVILVVGLGLWTIYGILLYNLPIIISSGTQFILEIIILGLIIKNMKS